jgi:hypothetical protein
MNPFNTKSILDCFSGCSTIRNFTLQTANHGKTHDQRLEANRVSQSPDSKFPHFVESTTMKMLNLLGKIQPDLPDSLYYASFR